MGKTDLPPINFTALAEALLRDADNLVPRWLPGGERRGHEYVCGSLAGGKGSSCSVNLVSGKWADFASDEKGNDLLSQLGGSALEGTVKSQLDKVYQTVGIKSGAGSVTFGKDGAFSTQMGNYKLSGTYTFDPSTHVAAMKFAKEKLGKEKLDLGEVPGHVSLSGTKMILVFPVSKLIEIIKSYGSKISSMETIVALLEQYKNVYIGFEFSKETGENAK